MATELSRNPANSRKPWASRSLRLSSPGSCTPQHPFFTLHCVVETSKHYLLLGCFEKITNSACCLCHALLCGTLLVACFMLVSIRCSDSCAESACVFFYMTAFYYKVSLSSTHLSSILQLLLGSMCLYMCYHDYENICILRFWISLRSCSFLGFTVCLSGS